MSSVTFTRTLTAAQSLTILTNYSYKKVSIEVKTGTCTVVGTGKMGGTISNELSMVLGDIITIGDGYEPLNGIVITAGAGSTVWVIGNQN